MKTHKIADICLLVSDGMNHIHVSEEFYVKHPIIYVSVDVLKKIQQSAYVAMSNEAFSGVGG